MTAIAASPILHPEREPRSTRFWIAVAVSVLLHVLVLGVWLLLGTSEAPKVPPPATMEVTIADDVGLTAGAPNTTVDPATSKAPEIDKPEESAPPPVPDPAPAKVEPAPPAPQPKAVPLPKPAPVAKVQPKVVAAPAARPAKVFPKPAAAPAKPVPTPGKGTGTTGTKLRPPSGLSFGKDYFKGATTQPNTASGAQTKAVTASPQARANFASKIAQQIQPCARNHKLPPTPGIEKVRVVVNLSFGRDGNPSAAPQIVRIEGLDDNTQRYADLVRRSAVATFTDRQCQPIRDLPAELYDVPGGWRSVTLGFRFPS